jgi:1-pyrroline-5-carboxylate dehydrogenase
MRRDRLECVRQEFHVGNLYFNRKCTHALVGVHPFGGFNMSGTDSKAGGSDYLQLFMQAKVVSEKL